MALVGTFIRATSKKIHVPKFRNFLARKFYRPHDDVRTTTRGKFNNVGREKQRAISKNCFASNLRNFDRKISATLRLNE